MKPLCGSYARPTTCASCLMRISFVFVLDMKRVYQSLSIEKMHDSATRKFNLMRQISGALLSPEYGTYFGAIKRRCWNCASNLVFSMTKKRVRFRDSKTALEISFCFIFFLFSLFLVKKTAFKNVRMTNIENAHDKRKHDDEKYTASRVQNL